MFAGGPKRTTRTLPSCEAETAPTAKAGSHEDPCEAKLSREGATYLLKRIALTQSEAPWINPSGLGFQQGVNTPYLAQVTSCKVQSTTLLQRHVETSKSSLREEQVSLQEITSPIASKGLMVTNEYFNRPT